MEQKTKLKNAESEDFIDNLKAVDFNNRSEENKYKWKNTKIYIPIWILEWVWLGKIIIDVFVVADSE